MSNILFVGDLHFGHKNIQKFRHEILSEEDNRQRIVADWKERVTKRDIVYVLGDAAFTMDVMEEFDSLPGLKYLVRGNHDLLNTSVYLKYFKEVYGILKYKDYWLSHAPIHPDELRGRKNIHGHVHYCSIPDERYINASVENIWKMGHKSLISLDEIRKL